MGIKLQVADDGSYRVKRKESGPKDLQNQNLAGNESGFIIIFFNKIESQVIHEAEHKANAPPLPHLVE